jgi:predicted RNase H-like nuclease
MVLIAGLDLAWTTYNKSGVCLLRENALSVELLKLEARVDTVAGFADELLGGGPDVVAAIDAPLLRRDGCTAERQLAVAFGRYRASAYTASVAFLESRKPPLVAGLRLGEALLDRGFTLDPMRLAPGARGRFAFEMYPHAFHVATFELLERLPYKKGRLTARRIAFGAYQAALRKLIQGECPSLLAAVEDTGILSPQAIEGGGRALKAVEDQLDALTCAVAALTAWRHGIRPGDVFGDAENGYIAVPGLHRFARFVVPSSSP